jgi:hypothetical protein
MKVKNTEGLEGKSLLAKVFLQKKMGVSEFFFKESGDGNEFFCIFAENSILCNL